MGQDGLTSLRQDRGRGDNSGDDWMTTYADAITLLMAFFVMMFSVSKLDEGRFETVRTAIQTEISHRTPQDTAGGPESFGSFLPPIDALKDAPDLEQVPEDERVSAEATETPREDSAQDRMGLLAEGSSLSRLAEEGMVSVERSEEGVVVEFASAALFDSGSGDLKDGTRSALTEVTAALLAEEFTAIEVEGHTDARPISTARYPSNWELSTSRATNVVRFLIDSGMPASMLRASGFADTRPKLDPETPEAQAMTEEERQAGNRRVIVRAVR